MPGLICCELWWFLLLGGGRCSLPCFLTTPHSIFVVLGELALETGSRLSDRKLQFLEGRICRMKIWKIYLGHVALFSRIWKCLNVRGQTETTLSLPEVVSVKFPNEIWMARPVAVTFITNCLARLRLKNLSCYFPVKLRRKSLITNCLKQKYSCPYTELAYTVEPHGRWRD